MKQEYIAGLGGFHTPRYSVEFVGPEEVLSTSGVQVAGARVYRDTAVLKQVAPWPQQEILRTPVVCEETWAFVP